MELVVDYRREWEHLWYPVLASSGFADVRFADDSINAGVVESEDGTAVLGWMGNQLQRVPAA